MRALLYAKDNYDYETYENAFGELWHYLWLEHKDVMVGGGVIEFEMGNEPVVWEKGSVPPSPGHVILSNNTAAS